jgi:hypothetical protein
MLSQDDSRRLAHLERQLRRDDPEFCARMSGHEPEAARQRVPLSVVLAAAVIWTTALVFGVVGWWIAAAIAALWATVLACTLALRCRPGRDRPTGQGPVRPS